MEYGKYIIKTRFLPVGWIRNKTLKEGTEDKRAIYDRRWKTKNDQCKMGGIKKEWDCTSEAYE